MEKTRNIIEGLLTQGKGLRFLDIRLNQVMGVIIIVLPMIGMIERLLMLAVLIIMTKMLMEKNGKILFCFVL